MGEKNPEAKVQSVTEKAFREVRSGHWEDAIKTLSELYCVGPATATSILCFVDPLGNILILRNQEGWVGEGRPNDYVIT